MNKKLLAFFIIGIFCIGLILASIYFFSSKDTDIIYESSLNSKHRYSSEKYIIPLVKPNEILRQYDVTIQNGNLKISSADWSFSLQPMFKLTNGNILNWSQIPNNIEKNLWKIEISNNQWEYGADFYNITDEQKNLLQQLILHRVDSENLTLDGVYIANGCIIINQTLPEVKLCNSDLLSTYSIQVINTTDIIIGGLDNTWIKCDSPISEGCILNHTETNWVYDVTTGTWNISFDPTITIDSPDWVTDAILTNTTIESGDANFTHLNISNTAPYDSLIGYWNFDGDKIDTTGATSYDFTKNNNDGTMFNQTVVNSTDCISSYGNCLHITGVEDFIDTVDDPLDIKANVDFTVAFWMKSTSIGTVASDLGGAEGWYIRAYSVDNIWIRVVETNGTISVTSNGDPIDDTWHHIVAGRNSTHKFIYIDGVFDKSTASVVRTNLSNTANVHLGDMYEGMPGEFDEFMIFNKSLTSSEIQNIYNNQSARFLPTGAFDLNNQTILNISTGNNRVNVSTTIQNNKDSLINLTVGYYNGSWLATAPQTISSLTNYTFVIDNSSTNLTLNYTFVAGNSTSNPFYSPIIQGDISVEIFNVTATVGKIITITNPTTASPLSVNDSDNISINFDFQDDGVNLTTGVTIDNVTIGGTLCDILTNDICSGTNSSCSSFPNETACNATGCSWSAGGGGTTTLFTEDFEADFTNWSNTGFTLESSPARGSQSAGCLVSVDCDINSVYSMDTSGAESVNVSIWFNVDDTEPADCYYYWNSSSTGWVQMQSCDSGAIPGCGGDDTWCQLILGSNDTQYLHSGFAVRVWADPDNNENVWFDDVQVNKTDAGGGCSGSSNSCSVYSPSECGVNDSGCSADTEYQFEYVIATGWEVNVTVPSGLSGLQDLFLNATHSGDTRNDTQSNAINYGDGDTCTYSSGNWNVDCSDNCSITSPVDVSGNNISITGTGTFTTTANISNYLNLLIKGTDSSNICRVRCLSGGCFID
jgi:hypothetical protein